MYCISIRTILLLNSADMANAIFNWLVPVDCYTIIHVMSNSCRMYFNCARIFEHKEIHMLSGVSLGSMVLIITAIRVFRHLYSGIGNWLGKN